jgi:hypothetical protein
MIGWTMFSLLVLWCCMILEGSTVECFSNPAILPQGVCAPRRSRILTELNGVQEGSHGQDSIRRRTLAFLPGFLLTGALSAGESKAAVPVVDTNGTPKVFTAAEVVGVEAGKERFLLAQQKINELADNYDEIAKTGGDSIRRYLGTVGTTSPLCGIGKVMKDLQEESSDIVEYTETMNDFDIALRAADTAAYSSIFVEFSSAKTKPEKFIKDAKLEIKNMQVFMATMANELGLKA